MRGFTHHVEPFLGPKLVVQSCRIRSLLLRSGDYALAREFLERAAADRPPARLDLAMAILQVDGPEPALQFLDKIPAAELSGDGLLLKANVLEAAGRNAEAREAFSSCR